MLGLCRFYSKNKNKNPRGKKHPWNKSETQDKEFYEECKKESIGDEPDNRKKANGKIPLIPIGNVPVPLDHNWPCKKVAIKKQ